MNRYWKAWGALIGSAIGVAAAYGLVPAGTEQSLTQAINILAPIIGATFGAYRVPPNAP